MSGFKFSNMTKCQDYIFNKFLKHDKMSGFFKIFFLNMTKCQDYIFNKFLKHDKTSEFFLMYFQMSFETPQTTFY
jgi:hypothetical protein